LLSLEIVLWLLIGAAVYAVAGYRLLVLALSKVWRKQFVRRPITPPVSLVIAAFNEEESIASKIENALQTDYPQDKLEIIVASDASTDRTDEIARSFAPRGVKLIRAEGNAGKSAMLSEVIRQARGEIILFSDATGMWTNDAVQRLVAHFADPRVGCVSGRVAYEYKRTAASDGFGVYQRFVTQLRRAEASFGAGFNAPGSIHAVRKSAFLPCPPALSMDLVDPFHVAMQGLRTTYEDQAISWEQARTSVGEEFRARLRIAVRSWSFVFYALRRLPLWRSPMYCFQLISHKFLRYTLGPSLLLIFALSAALASQHVLYRVLFVGQVAFWLATLAAYLASRSGRRIPGLSALLFFNSANVAYIRGLFLYLMGRRVARWNPAR
jgi:cellulose synthase/poly-beta-1,6-N-acetylglucosamine synthase-like glycosyltransferase